MSASAEFEEARARDIERQGQDVELRRLATEWMVRAAPYRYSYNFTWLGRPVIQFPQDLLALQEVIWNVRPERIVETGIAHGGSLIFHASLLQLLGGNGRVLGVDIDIRAHNRAAIETHPLAERIDLLEGSSTDPSIVEKVAAWSASRSTMIVLDSDHSHQHVLDELRMYGPLVTPGSYLVVMDTTIDDVPESFSRGKDWGPDSNPRTAVREFLEESLRFEVDRLIDAKLVISAARGGFLRCIDE